MPNPGGKRNEPHWLVYVDFKTQKRTPKLSTAWHSEAARRNAVA